MSNLTFIRKRTRFSNKLNKVVANIVEFERKMRKEAEENAKFKSMAEKNAYEVKTLTNKINYLESKEYTTKVLDIF